MPEPQSQGKPTVDEMSSSFDYPIKRRRRKRRKPGPKQDYAALLKQSVELSPEERCPHSTRMIPRSSCSQCMQASGAEVKVQRVTPSVAQPDWLELDIDFSDSDE